MVLINKEVEHPTGAKPPRNGALGVQLCYLRTRHDKGSAEGLILLFLLHLFIHGVHHLAHPYFQSCAEGWKLC